MISIGQTSKTPFEISRMETSKVPPPRSYTANSPSFLSAGQTVVLLFNDVIEGSDSMYSKVTGDVVGVYQAAVHHFDHTQAAD